MVPLTERLKLPGIITGDGAMGTMLFLKGLRPGDSPETMNLEHPEILEEIARLYLESGAEILETNTFGASPLKLAHYGLEGKTEQINAAAVRAARKASAGRAYISASCGPSGRLLAPFGDATEELIYGSFLRQMTALASEGVDMFCIETMTDLSEAILAVRAARAASGATPVCATMTFDATPRGFFTTMGVSIEDAARDLGGAGADIVGSNCGNGIATMVLIAREFKRHTRLPVIIQSNAGIPVSRGGVLLYPETPAFTAASIPALIASGVKIIGGCCGTTPEHIAAIRHAVDRHNTTAGTGNSSSE
jgi:5-methyltetrahydrofolate--homocysteine methyltransferase